MTTSSLRRKFLGPVLFGGLVVTLAGLWIIQDSAADLFQAQLAARGRTLATYRVIVTRARDNRICGSFTGTVYLMQRE